ncbi:MAG: serine--tRNA ligase [Pseudomonadota bacterium]
MLDIRLIRDNPSAIDKALIDRGSEALSRRILALDDARRDHLTKLQDAQSARNAASKEIGKAKAMGNEAEAQRLIAEVAEHKSFIQAGEEEERRLTAALEEALAGLPNLALHDVPVGADEDANVEVRQAGTKSIPNFEAKEHFELGEAMGLMDFETAAKLSGSRFCVMKGALAKLERALGQFMLDSHSRKNGYLEVAPPLLVRDEAMFGTGQLPKFAEDQFRATKHGEEGEASHLWLVPTAEVPLTNLVRETILDEAQLPLRFTALTPCFRGEAGAAGRDTRGYIRQHQFYKVEMVSVTHPKASADELERMTACAESVLTDLGLHIRTMVLSTGDMGFGARKTYDIEVWLPGQGRYREISSCSICGDFQARRMQARYRDENGKPQFVHTLNGSGVATGRALVAVMETHQTEEGGVRIPDVLIPYMGGTTFITADGVEH